MTTPIVQGITDEQLAGIEVAVTAMAGAAVPLSPEVVIALIDRLRAAEADAKRLEFYVRECCVMECMNGYSSPVVYRLYWPHEGEHQDAWHPTERDAIDAAMERQP